MCSLFLEENEIIFTIFKKKVKIAVYIGKMLLQSDFFV